MIPRTEVVFLDAALPVDDAVTLTASLPHSRYPVTRGSSDEIVGFVHLRDLLVASRERARVERLVRTVKMLPASLNVLRALSEMRREGHHLAIVVDEYGGTAGIVTLEDLIEEVIGDIRDEYDPAARDARILRGGDVEVSGLLNLDDFADATGIRLPEGPYETVAGFVVSRLGHLPGAQEQITVPAATLTVTALDGRRVERIRVHLVPVLDAPGVGTLTEVATAGQASGVGEPAGVRRAVRPG
jgi:putative hemolysin